MKSPLSQLLNQEHDIILKAGKIIGLQAGLWLSHPAEYERSVKQLLDFFSIYADEFHHHKEEEILFPAISKKSETCGTGMVAELIVHHKEFRTEIQEIRTALSAKTY